MSKIKICGLSRPEDVAFVNEAKPDYAGFVIQVPKSIRNVSVQTLYRLRKQLREEIPAVGVFVDAPLDLVVNLCRNKILSYVQLHGQENGEYIKRLKEQTEVPVIQAFSISSREDVQKAAASQADYPLLDHGRGGTGESFDWSLISHMERPYFLAGGLTSKNVGEAIETLHPFAMDMSSSVETDGKKDYEKIMAAVAAVRSADR